MALDNVPWFIGGGAEHSPAIARQLAYAATNGATGINSATDLRVTALPTPGPFARIMPGGGVMLNRYPGGGQQSYTVRNPSATDVAVPATGSAGGSTRYVILRVDDPEFGGQAPANVVTGPYVRAVLVNSITNLAYPFLPLAKITQPANTATITQAMITDLRGMANPREKQLVLAKADLIDGMQLTGSTSDGQSWPTQGAEYSIDVPDWATSMQIEALWISVQLQPANTSGWGDYWVDYGPVLRPEKHQYSTQIFHWDLPAGDVSRGTWNLATEVAVPPALRGTRVPFRMKANKSGSAVPKMDSRSGAVLKVRFLEVAES